jgi:hypothetical protein
MALKQPKLLNSIRIWVIGRDPGWWRSYLGLRRKERTPFVYFKEADQRAVARQRRTTTLRPIALLREPIAVRVSKPSVAAKSPARTFLAGRLLMILRDAAVGEQIRLQISSNDNLAAHEAPEQRQDCKSLIVLWNFLK